MCPETYSLSLPTPPTREEVNEYRNRSPTKYSPGSPSTTPPVVGRITILSEDGQLDPAEVRGEPRTPDHVCHVWYAPVFEHWLAVPDARYPRNTLDLGSDDVFGLEADQWGTMPERTLSQPPTEPGIDGEHVVEDPPDAAPAETQRYAAGVASREVRAVGRCLLHGDLRPRVACPDDEDAAFLELIGVVVLAGVELHNLRV